MGMSKQAPLNTLRLGLDDTDHSEIGCTTERMANLINTISSNMESVHIERRLVRLWPFAKRRTRGNGALGATILIHEEDKESFLSICSDWFSDLTTLTQNYPPSRIAPSPCLVISEEAVPESWYWSAVRGEVDCEKRLLEVRNRGCTVLLSDSSWGVVGASAAISWQPKDSSSWELIAWREEKRIGSPRQVSEQSVMELEPLHPGAFVNRDPTKGRGLIAPRTPCPVLYGIRGATEHSVSAAHEWMQNRDDVESCSMYATHRTNQLSDDHIESLNSGTVTSLPSETKGGHAVIHAISPERSYSLMAFSEGGPVNRLLRSLIPGDMISWAGLLAPDDSIHLEKLRVDTPSPRIAGRPVCCAISMRSEGKGQGLRCNICGNRTPKYWMCNSWQESLNVGIGEWVEPTPSNRRHLARPVSLM
jgi:tRNA(Ile2)-agmatinylcytidine synthase